MLKIALRIEISYRNFYLISKLSRQSSLKACENGCAFSIQSKLNKYKHSGYSNLCGF